MIVGHFPLSVGFLDVVDAVAGSAQASVETIGRHQYTVADHFGFEPSGSKSPQPTIVRIQLHGLR